MILTGEKDIRGGNLFHSHVVYHTSHMDCLGIGLDPPRGDAGD